MAANSDRPRTSRTIALNDRKSSVANSARDLEHRIQAIAVSRGVAIGTVLFLQDERRIVFRDGLDEKQVRFEIEKLHKAVSESIVYLRKLSNDKLTNDQVSSIFDFHLLILEDPSFVQSIETAIASKQINVESAIRSVSKKHLDRQKAIENSHLRDRYLDIADVSDRLLISLEGLRVPIEIEPNTVIAARELWPSTIMELVKGKPAGIVTERGGWTSHASILAREFKLPMVSGVKDLTGTILKGDRIIVDAINGEVIVNPGEAALKHYNTLGPPPIASVFDANKSQLTTLDGTKITIRANADLPETFEMAHVFGVEGIGLYRSESLISRPGIIPSEEEQVSSYCEIGRIAGNGGVRIRTFDMGVEQFGSRGPGRESNPALGLRGIRLSLSQPVYFRPQIRAILRASSQFDLDIVLPMISGVSEVLRAKEIVAEEKMKLTVSGVETGNPRIGAMIEVPSAVLMAREILKNVDFVCLGTNDLVQYLLAVDRDNESVVEWYQTLHPAVIRAIEMVISECGTQNIPISVCGEMAGSPFYLPILIGLGSRDLSMNAVSVSQIQHMIAHISLTDSVRLVEIIKPLESALEVEKVVREFYAEHWGDLFLPGQLKSRPGTFLPKN